MHVENRCNMLIAIFSDGPRGNCSFRSSNFAEYSNLATFSCHSLFIIKAVTLVNNLICCVGSTIINLSILMYRKKKKSHLFTTVDGNFARF